KVVSHFGRIVLERLSEKEISGCNVKAMCARKTGESSVPAGRHLSDYWPAYGEGLPRMGMRSGNFWSLIGDAGQSHQETSISARVSDVRRALLLVLREAGAPLAKDLRDGRALPRAANAFAPNGCIEALTRQLVLSGKQLCLIDQRVNLFQRLLEGLRPYLPDALELDAFKALSVFSVQAAETAAAPPKATKCEVSHQERSLQFLLGTVASMKGETHS